MPSIPPHRPFALLVLLACLPLLGLATLMGDGALAGPEEGEGARRRPGLIPDPDQAADADPGATWFATRVLDARTLKPIQGARWIRTPESIAGWRLHHDVVLATAVTDAEGIAYLPTERDVYADDCHWLVQAPGYATAHEYGSRPEPETLLEAETVQRGRILDPLGRPVAGARVEFLGGCSHGTAASRAVTEPDGSFLLPRLPASLPGQLWIEGPGIASSLLAFDAPLSRGASGMEIVMEPGPRLEGRLVDLLGEPIAGAIVRAWNAQRGPTAMTGTQGHFVIDGVEPDTMLYVYAPGDLLESDECRGVEGARPGTPIRLTVSPLGIVEREQMARVRLRARRADGEPVAAVTCCLLSKATGLGISCNTTDIEDVAPGRYRIVADGAFDGYAFDPVDVTAVAGATVDGEVVVRAQPCLLIRGTMPEDAELTLSVCGASLSERVEGAAWRPPLPLGEPAVLRVQCDGRPAFFFPVGPALGEVRVVTVTLPMPHRLLLPVGASSVALRDGARDVVGFRQGEFYATDASGPLTLTFEGAEGHSYELSIVVPEDSAGPIPLDLSMARETGGTVAVMAVLPGQALPPKSEWKRVEPGEVVAFERPGWRRLRTVVPRAAKTVLRWGGSSLRLHVRAEGEAPDALALIAGEVYALPAGTLELRGFEPGPLRIVVARRDAVGRVALVHAVMKDGAVTTCEVDLAAE